MCDTRVVTHIYHVRYQIYVTDKNGTKSNNVPLRVLFEKMYQLKTTRYEIKLVQLGNGRILLSILARPKRTPVHITSFEKLPAPVRYQLIKDLIDNKLAHILDQI